MNRNILIGVGVVAIAALMLLLNALFTVHQTQQALVLQFGNPVDVVKEPGLSAKMPFIQQVEYFDRRVLDFDAPSVELILGDQKRLVVDAFVRYRITDPLRFRQSVGSEIAFRGRLEPITFSALRSVLGEASLFTVLSQDRVQLMDRIRGEANTALSRFGVELVDVRIKRADLPAENSQAIFRRMQTEREREARELRAQGAEVAQRIRARADRERRVLIAEAQRQAEVLRGQGDAEAITIFAESFGRDPAFFDFYRSMQAYREALGDGSTSFVLSPDSDFFRYFGTPLPATAAVAPEAGQTPPAQSQLLPGQGGPESAQAPPAQPEVGTPAQAAQAPQATQAPAVGPAPPAVGAADAAPPVQAMEEEPVEPGPAQSQMVLPPAPSLPLAPAVSTE
ncbi:MAG TPA: protease modulator HflC [Geminicoccaceae bacterium]|nr:protease modulator HflC [Geminicoccaceae bacterium]